MKHLLFSFGLMMSHALFAGGFPLNSNISPAEIQPLPSDLVNAILPITVLAPEAVALLPPSRWAEPLKPLPAHLAAKLKRGPKEPHGKPDEAQKWFLYQRTKGAPLDYRLLQAGLDQMNGLAGSTPITAWNEVGPGDFAGRTRSLLIDPKNPDRLLTGGVAGGVWRSANGGASWTALDDHMDNLAVTCLEFGRTSGELDTQIIYAGTGEGFGNPDGIRGFGIFKSSDGGDTWTHLNNTSSSDFRFVNKVRVSPNHVDRVYAATQTGLFRSDNAGDSWSLILSPDTNGDLGFTDLVLVSVDGQDRLLAASGSLFGDGVFRSTDSGDNWNKVLDSSQAANLGRITLAFAPSDADIAYALVAESFNGNLGRLVNLFRSNDGGATWTPQISGSFDPTNVNWLLLTNPLFANLSTCSPGAGNQQLHQGWYDNIVAVAPHDPDVVYVGGIDIFRSDDGGQNFGIAGYWWLTPRTLDGFIHADQHIIRFHPDWDGAGNQTLITGNDGGLYKSTNAMAPVESDICYDSSVSITWENINNGFNITQFYAGRPLIETDGGIAYFGGTQDNGTPYGSEAGGPGNWNDLLSGDGGYVHFDPNNSDILIGENTNLTIARTTLGPTASFPDFEFIGNGIDTVSTSGQEKDRFPFITAFRADPSEPDRIWIGSSVPWRSNNAVSAATESGVTWSQAGQSFSGGNSANAVSAWAIDPNNSDVVYAGTENGDIFKITNATSSNGSTTWQNISSGFNGSFVSWLEVDPNNSNVVYATNSVYDSQGRVYKTSDAGVSGWTDITNNLPSVPTHCIVIHPEDSNILFVGNEMGILASTNGGDSWTSTNPAGLPNTVVETMEFLDGKLYAFTHGRGVWQADLTDCILPSITDQDTTLVGCEADPITLSVTAPGVGLSFQWRTNDADIPGAEDPTLTLNSPSTADSGSYECVVSNACGSISSQPIELTINAGADITQQPQPQSNCEGEDITFTVASNDSSPLFQWRLDGVDLPGQTNSSLTIQSITTADAGDYDCRVTGECGETLSQAAALTITPTTAVITDPQSASACLGSSLELTVIADGNALSYQWRLDTIDIPGANAATLPLADLSEADAGDYSCVVSGTCGQATSAAASVTVSAPVYDPIFLPLWRNPPEDPDCEDLDGNGIVDISDFVLMANNL